MWRFVTERLDRLAIASACGSIPQSPSGPPHIVEARGLIEQADFFEPCAAPIDPSFSDQHTFQFASQINTPWPENNLVRGKFYPVAHHWRQRPAVILLHGWNGELGYWWQFPVLARYLNHAGLNVAMLELPYHAQRKPAVGADVRNFLSHDLHRVAEAVHQSLHDTRALLTWLAGQGCPAVGLWGFSLGAWLAGLSAAHLREVSFAVLTTPVVRMDRAFDELEFCAPIRRALGGVDIPIDPFNLARHPLLVLKERVLIIEALYDLFVPVETVEELWSAWDQPGIWRLPHGHISILTSLPIMQRTIRWIEQVGRTSSHESLT